MDQRINSSLSISSMNNETNFYTGEMINQNDVIANESFNQYATNSIRSMDNGSTGFDSQSRADQGYSTFNQQTFQSETNATPLFHDPNPQIIRRPAQTGPLTYTQNIQIRFLQPPPLPPPGVRQHRYEKEEFQRSSLI